MKFNPPSHRSPAVFRIGKRKNKSVNMYEVQRIALEAIAKKYGYTNGISEVVVEILDQYLTGLAEMGHIDIPKEVKLDASLEEGDVEVERPDEEAD